MSVPEWWREASVVVVLLVFLWAGSRGWWYWSPGVKAMIGEVSRERDDWRALACALLRKQGVELPTGFERATKIHLPGNAPTSMDG